MAKARSLPRCPSAARRLTRVRTTRPSAEGGTATALFRDARVVQDQRYTYDASGNVVRIEDAAHRTLLRGGTQVEPASEYTYDSTDRLVEATGREHVAQGGLSFEPPNGNYRDYPFVGHRAHANDLEALQGYVQRFEYDAEGNFELFRHLAASGGYTRQYGYSAPSLLEPGKQSNRVTSTQVGSAGTTTERYTYDAHGNTLSMPHLARLGWDFEDQLTTASLGGGGTAHYVYDAGGQRVKKVIEAGSGVRTKERIYLGGFEIYREYGPDGVTVEEERETLHVMDDTRRIALVETKTVTRGRAVPEPSVVRFQLANHLGSATLELDDAGAVIAYEEFHPYGTSAFQAGRSAAEVSFKRYRYTGLERDEETGFGYHAARYLAPWLGRWVSCDPSGIRGGVNLFEYVEGHPCQFVDLHGHDGWNKLTGAIQIIAGIGEAGSGANLMAAGLLSSETGIGLAAVIPGAAIALHGLDNVYAGGKQLWTGEPTETVTSRALQKYGGFTKTSAALGDAVISIGGTLEADLAAEEMAQAPNLLRTGILPGSHIPPTKVPTAETPVVVQEAKAAQALEAKGPARPPGAEPTPVDANQTPTAPPPAPRSNAGSAKPPTGRPSKPVVEKTSTSHRSYDPSNVRLQASGYLQDGELSLTIRAELEDGTRGTLKGAEEFSNIVDHFGNSSIDSIKASWSYGDNLLEFNRMTLEGRSIETAALQTWTGKQASQAGFSSATVSALEGTPGHYTKVVVLFKRN